MKIETIEISQLVLDPRNARKHPTSNLEAIKASLKRFGQVRPIVVGENNVVVAGNGTLMAALALGFTDVDIVRMGLDAKAQKAYALTDNQTALLAEWDEPVLTESLKELLEDGWDMSDFGFDVPDMEDVEQQPSESSDDNEEEVSDDIDDEMPETVPEVAVPGGIYNVENNILHCGDCLEVLKTLEADSVDSLVTDPPAGISFMAKDWDDDKGGSKQWIAWMTEVMTECLRVLKPGAHGLVWAIPRTSHWTATALENAGFEIRDVVTHLFGSGFPKSRDISKDIDKIAGAKREVIGKKPFSSPDTRGDHSSGTGGWGSGVDKGRERLQLDITAPSTPEAKQWQGFGTALKPSFEAWLLVAKPFTTVPLDAILSDLNSILRDFICQQLSAKYAKQISMSNLRDYNGQQFDFAQWLAEVWNIVESSYQKQTTDISISPETASIYLSIVSIWKNILDVLLKNRNTFTISMESSLITELKTLKYSILQITQESITQVDNQTNTQALTATVAQNLLISGLLRLKGLMEIFVQENVSTQAASLKPDQKEKLLQDLATIKGVLSEHWILIRKPLSEKTVAKNVLKWNTGGLNIDASRISNADTSTTSQALGNVGRFPSNLVLSHNPDCEETCTEGCAVKALDEQSGVLKSGSGKKSVNRNSPCHDGGFGPDLKEFQSSTGGASRFFYCAKASKSDKGSANTHPTVKSVKLMSYFVTLVTPPNGIVLDVFNGSGTTGMAAIRDNFKYIGIEQDQKYCDISLARWAHCIQRPKQ